MRPSPRCPRCAQPLTRSEIGALLATGKPGAGGRPRKRGPRCPCGKNMQSARVESEHKARADAERLFGPLDWQAPISAGITTEYVMLVAAMEVKSAQIPG